MNTVYDSVGKVFEKAQAPIQDLLELNMKTLQSFSYLRPDQMINFKKPEDLIEKQISIALENSHNLLNYMQKSFQICEESCLAMWKDLKSHAGDLNLKSK